MDDDAPSAAAAAPVSKTAVEKTTVFRGNWVPTIDRPVGKFGAFQFLPVPPPQEPRKKPAPAAVVVVEEEEVVAAEEPPQEEPPGELMTGPSPDWDVLFVVFDREKNYRACIAKDGTCYNNVGQILGFINRDTNECGSASEMYLGVRFVVAADTRRLTSLVQSVVQHPFGSLLLCVVART